MSKSNPPIYEASAERSKGQYHTEIGQSKRTIRGQSLQKGLPVFFHPIKTGSLQNLGKQIPGFSQSSF